MADSPTVFLSYGTPDRSRVLPFCDYLISRGIDVWIDVRQLRAGQNWDFEIKRALKRAALIIIFVSDNTTDRRGYIQREVKLALDRMSEKLIDDVYVIPVLLDDDAQLPDQLSHIQYVRANDPNCKVEIEEAVRSQLSRIGMTAALGHTDSGVTWTIASYQDAWDGLPGYECKIQYPHFSSTLYPYINEVSDIIKGSLLRGLQNMRSVKFEGQGLYNHFGEAKSLRTNTWDAYCGEPTVKERVLSILYTIGWYGAGAAHPNYDLRTFCFLLDPLIEIPDLKSVFTDQDAALLIMQDCIRSTLLNEVPSKTPNGYTYEQNWVYEGTKDWEHFRAFQFGKDGLEISFEPYLIAPFSEGVRMVSIPYTKLANNIRRPYLYSLGINYLI